MEIRSTAQVASWIDALKDTVGRARILARIRRLADGNPGDHRHLTEGISELRINVGPGYRVYYTQRRNAWVILLVAGDKSSQRQDIEMAKRLARDI